MSFLFNARLVKCIRRIFPVVKHNISINSYKQTFSFPNSKQSALNSTRYIQSNRTNAAKSIVFGFSILGLNGLPNSEKYRELYYTTKRGLSYLDVSEHLTYLE